MSSRLWHREAGALLCLLVVGCGGASGGTPQPPDRIVHVRGSRGTRIVLSAQGAQRIGLQTAAAQRSGSGVLIPYSAIVYDPSGKAYVFTRARRLTFAPVRIHVQQVNSDLAYLARGVAPGTRVVTVGAEELLGAQSGVLAQT